MKDVYGRRMSDPTHHYDELGRKVPVKITFLMVARLLPGLAAEFDIEVPGEFFAQVEEAVVEVACPCGGQPRLTTGEVNDCVCGRVFTYTGQRVLVARFSTPVAVPA